MSSIAQDACDFFELVKITTGKANINTSESDYAPAFVGNELWYSGYTADEIGSLKDGETKGVFYNLFATGLNDSGDLTGSKSMKLSETSNNFHAGPVSFCEKTGELFVTLSNFEAPEVQRVVFQKANIRLKIIVVQKEGSNWVIKGEIPFNNPSHSVGHPAISASGDTLFFVSDIPEKGQGGTDIYMSIRKDGQWGEMINLGTNINTGTNEMFPCLFRGNTLIFASNGHKDSGTDLDLYYSCMTSEGFSTPKSLASLNSSADDFGLVIHKNETVGYYTSAKSGGSGSDDIYKVEFEGNYELELTVLDKETKLPLLNPKVNFSDNIVAALAGSLFKRALKRNSTYTVNARAEGYMAASKSITTVGKPFGVIKETIVVEKLKKDKVFVLDNIFYDFDKWNILPESEAELDKLVEVMSDNPKIKVELSSHTDSRGSNAYNEVLSQKRSDSAVGYIVGKGIRKDRIVSKGYGESKLINRCDDGVDCEEEEHRKNRRTEFKVLDMGE